ncbi:MAG: hypothetical protein Q8S02_16865 [Hydrogenophaga sp.]|nr:hypothetical protein [Hydrogenophaga sp.]
MNFLIAVEVPAKGPMELLVHEVQQAYDNGAFGNFQCIVTHQPSYIVLFERTAAEGDWGYLQDHMRQRSIDIQRAAQLQLAVELMEGLDRDNQTYLPTIIETLKEFDAQVVDFIGVLKGEMVAA